MPQYFLARVYYLESNGTVRRQDYASGNQAPGIWGTPVTIGTDTFVGEPNGAESFGPTGTYVFAARSNGEMWYANDPN